MLWAIHSQSSIFAQTNRTPRAIYAPKRMPPAGWTCRAAPESLD